MYLELNEFMARLPTLVSLTGGDLKRELAAQALEQAHAMLNARLTQRYETPLLFASLPPTTQSIVKRWVYYLAIRELIGIQGIAFAREEPPVLTEMFELVDLQIDQYTTGALLLEGVPARGRVRVGYAEVLD